MISLYKSSQIQGGALATSDFQALLNASYDSKINLPKNWIRDKELSKDSASVFLNYATGQVVVAHRGTISTVKDWSNNLVYAIGGEKLYKTTDRYKISKDVQKSAEAKYGAENVTTISHSQGGIAAELVGGKSKEIINYNKATAPFQANTINKNQTDVSADFDVISRLNPFQNTKAKSRVKFDAKSKNILYNHSIKALDNLQRDTVGKK